MWDVQWGERVWEKLSSGSYRNLWGKKEQLFLNYMKKISHHWQYNTHWHFMQWTNKINYLKLQKFCPTTCMVAGQINQNTLDHFTLMSEAAITTYTGQNSQDTKAIAHQDDAIFLPPSQWWSVDVMHSSLFQHRQHYLVERGTAETGPYMNGQ